MRIVKNIGWVLILTFAAAACGLLPSGEGGNEMVFSENEVIENDEGMEFSEEEAEDSSENGMEFTEEEVEGDDGMEFSEDEVDSDASPAGADVILPQGGGWMLLYAPGYVKCGSGPYMGGQTPLEESVTLSGYEDGQGFEMQQAGQDRTLSFSAVYTGEFLDPFAENIVNYTSPADMLLVNQFAYQTAFQEGGADFYMILYPLSETEMIGTFWVLQDGCQIEKQVTATHQ